MELKKLIIHKLDKESGSGATQPTFSDRCLNITEKTEALKDRLVNAFKSDSTMYANFVDKDRSSFPVRLIKYFGSSQNENEFVNFSKDVLFNLNEQLHNVPAAKGGFFVFLEYERYEHTYLCIFLVRDTTGTVFPRDAESAIFEVGETIYINTEKLAMACRVSFHGFHSNTARDLSLTRKQREISDYFSNWLAAGEPETNQEYTNDFFKLTGLLELPVNEETGKQLELNEFRRLVYEYVNSQPNKNVDLRSLSQHFYGDENTILDFAETEGIEIATEFKAHSKGLKKFYLVDVNEDGIQLKFSRGEWGRGKINFGEKQNQIVIESEALYKKLSDEVERGSSSNTSSISGNSSDGNSNGD